jgi:tight adherence protein B
MILYFGVLVIAAALFLIAERLISRYRIQAAAVEAEWLSLFNRGLSHEFFFFDVGEMKRWIRILIAICFVLSLITFSPLPIVIGLVAIWGIPYFSLRSVQLWRRNRFQKQFANVLPLVASTLRAGHSFERALESLSRTQPNPMAQELELVLKEVRLGATLDEALQSLLQRFPIRDLEILITAISISRRVGSNLAEVFSKVSDMVQTRQNLKNRLSSLTAQGRVQGWIAIIMPIALLLIVRLMAPDYLDPLFHTSKGHIVLLICAAKLTLGGIWIHKIAHMELIR